PPPRPSPVKEEGEERRAQGEASRQEIPLPPCGGGSGRGVRGKGAVKAGISKISMPRRLARRRGDLPEDVAAPAALRPEAPRLPAMGAQEVADDPDERLAVAREDHEGMAVGVVDRLDRGDFGQAAELVGGALLVAGGERQADGVAVARMRLE